MVALYADNGPALLRSSAMALDEAGERFELLLDEITRGIVLQLAGLLIEFRGATPDEDLRLVQGERIEEDHRLAQLILNARPAERPRRGRLNRDRLAGERLVLQT